MTEIEDRSDGVSGNGTWPSKTSDRKTRVTFDLSPEPFSFPPVVTEDSLVSSTDQTNRDYFLRQEAGDKWHFPRVKVEKKYLSL